MAPPLNVFYAEPEPDRWVPGDRYPRRLIRRLVRGKPRPGGQMRVFLNLVAGLERIGVQYRVNDFAHATRHPNEVACIVGKPFLLDRHRWRNPIVFGSAVESHPSADPMLFERTTVRRILVPGDWMRRMFEPVYGARVFSWPVGIDTHHWLPAPDSAKDVDVLVYEKLRWHRARDEAQLLLPALQLLASRGLKVEVLKYGDYREEEFRSLLDRSRAMLFLCSHETQGIAYQQALSCGVPVLAWDRGGPWEDPAYFPRIVFEPVTSVPYWDDRCGERFAAPGDLAPALDRFMERLARGHYSPRAYILEHLTLESCAREYLGHVAAVQREWASQTRATG